MSSKLNKSELEKMLSDLQSELKIIKNKMMHSKEERKMIERNYRKNIQKIDDEYHDLNHKHSIIMENIGRLNSLISASRSI